MRNPSNPWLIVLVLLLSHGLCSAQQVVDKMVATVNAGVRTDLITYSDLLWQLALQPGTVLDNPTSQDLNFALSRLIDQRLILQEAEKLPTIVPTQKEINDLALMMRATLGGMSKALKNAPFNLVFHLSPEKKNSRLIHWHIEVYPQMNTWSGLERGFGVFINNVRPEKSAEILGSSCRKELAGLVGIV